MCIRDRIYHDTAEQKLTQLIFCDQGTPKYDGTFNFYEATKTALLAHCLLYTSIAYERFADEFLAIERTEETEVCAVG